MAIHLISYASKNMTQSQQKCVESGLRHGVDMCNKYNPSDIDRNFVYQNPVLNEPRGAGYWLWKPYIIFKHFDLCGENDTIIYADAGVEFINSIHHIIDRMDQNAFLFTNTHPNHHWTKRYVLDQMLPEWQIIYGKDTPWPQVQASVIILKVCEETRNFVKEWLLWCQMPNIINDVKGPYDELPYFQDHRHDQSVITVLARKYGYKLHWWPSQYAMHIRVPGDDYPVLVNHHRRRNKGMGNGDAEWPDS